MKPKARSAFLYLRDGRLFVRRDDGTIVEADASERGFAAYLLTVHETAAIDPTRGLELVPPGES